MLNSHVTPMGDTMTQASIRERLAAAAEAAGVVDAEGVLNSGDDVPVCGAIRLADACGMGMTELFR
jgi:hypothetical protein